MDNTTSTVVITTALSPPSTLMYTVAAMIGMATCNPHTDGELCRKYFGSTTPCCCSLRFFRHGFAFFSTTCGLPCRRPRSRLCQGRDPQRAGADATQLEVIPFFADSVVGVALSTPNCDSRRRQERELTPPLAGLRATSVLSAKSRCSRRTPSSGAPTPIADLSEPQMTTATGWSRHDNFIARQ